MFDLEEKISEWRKQMLTAGIKTPVPLEELEIHLREEIERQLNSGANEQQAFEISVQRFGQSNNIEIEFKKIESAFMKKILICKIIRFLGLLFSVWTIWGVFITFVTSMQYGAKGSLLHYTLIVTVPYMLLAILLVLPYSKMKDGLWKLTFTLLCLSGGYVCLFLVTHLPSEDWPMIYIPWLFILSQPIAIWISRKKSRTELLSK